MLPSGTSVTGLSGSVRPICSSKTSQTRFAEEREMVSMTNTIESIIRQMSICTA